MGTPDFRFLPGPFSRWLPLRGRLKSESPRAAHAQEIAHDHGAHAILKEAGGARSSFLVEFSKDKEMQSVRAVRGL